MSALPKTTAGLVLEDLGNEVVVYDPHSKQAHVLNDGGAGVLLMCDGNTSVDAIVKAFAECSGLEAKEATRQIMAILAEFRHRDLVRFD